MRSIVSPSSGLLLALLLGAAPPAAGGVRPVVLGIGDSVTSGSELVLHSPPGGYLSLLQSSLKGAIATRNRGIPGATSADLLGRVDGFLDADRPGVTIVMAGVNDALLGVPAETTVANIEQIALRAAARGSAVVLCTTTPVKPEERPAQYAALARLNPQIAALARRRGYPLLDFWGLFHADPQWQRRLMDPGSPNHPGAAGYALIARHAHELITRRGLLDGASGARPRPPGARPALPR